MPNQRQPQHRNMGGGYQNGEAYSFMPVGTKLQGHIDSIKGSFGFIRSDSCVLSLVNVQANNCLRQELASHVPPALQRWLQLPQCLLNTSSVRVLWGLLIHQPVFNCNVGSQHQLNQSSSIAVSCSQRVLPSWMEKAQHLSSCKAVLAVQRPSRRSSL